MNIGIFTAEINELINKYAKAAAAKYVLKNLQHHAKHLEDDVLVVKSGGALVCASEMALICNELRPEVSVLTRDDWHALCNYDLPNFLYAAGERNFKRLVKEYNKSR